MYDYSMIRARMAEKNISQTELGKKIGLKETTLSTRFTGQTDFKQAEMMNICAALRIPFNQIPKYFFVKKGEQK